ncbi:MAG: glycosyltransferase family 39 protein [Candidatus Competibacteraceae bacterium]|nr:glycosyltransferase family 39 protein [Candidatus Competibacteraceae bacterium]MCP5124241.1 glycosyltransferase family 39 protein [Gammaproteobacteria bacterium]HRX70161.1 glycosyltransferase family 39 protein [Candidatus Competibacteraceae bacterium]
MDLFSLKSPHYSRWFLLGLLLVFTLVWFSNLESRKLFRPDEGRYAEIAREMAVSGDWITPHLNGLKYFEKPPLQYWATAAAFKLFGEHHWTARWWPATTSFACVLLMFWVGRRLYDEEVGLAAAAALGGCTWFLLNAHFNALDAGLTAFLTIALLSFLMAQRPDATPVANRNWMLIVWAAMALAVLSKGLIGIVLPGAVLTLYILIERDWRMLTRLHLGKGLALFLFIAAPWFIAVSLLNDEFAKFFFIHEHFARFTTDVHRRTGAWWYFVPELLIGSMPWLPFIAVRLRDGWRREGERGMLQPLRLLLIWATFIFVFFSVSHSKLPSYILPIFPALALFAGVEMQRMEPKRLSRLAWGLAAIGGLLLLLILLGGEHLAQAFSNDASPFEMVRTLVPWLLASIATFTAGAGAAAGLFRQTSRNAGIIALALGSLSAGILVMNGHNELSRLYSADQIVQEIEAEHGPFDPSAPFYSIQMHDQTLPFYLKRPVTLVQYTDEFALGLAAEPEKGIAKVEDWKSRWRALEKGYAIMNHHNYQHFTAEGLPMRLLARDPRRVIVSRQ